MTANTNRTMAAVRARGVMAEEANARIQPAIMVERKYNSNVPAILIIGTPVATCNHRDRK